MSKQQTILYTEERPWGSFTILDEGKDYKVKKIIIKPHHRLSLQYHTKRAEQWIIATGTALITIGNEVKTYKAGQNAYIPQCEIHRIHNNTDSDIIFFEVQNGEYLGEDDIIRIEDDYSRN